MALQPVASSLAVAIKDDLECNVAEEDLERVFGPGGPDYGPKRETRLWPEIARAREQKFKKQESRNFKFQEPEEEVKPSM